MLKTGTLCATTIVLMTALNPGFAGDLTANAGITNNYIWRGLTQTQNQAAVSGGLDFAFENGLYIGTWVTNVNYAPNDAFSYENDIYFGYSAAGKNLAFDLGYLYYNYDDTANFDFGEIYGGLSIAGFDFGGYVLANTEANEGASQDFGFGEAYYMYLDYAIDIKDGLELGLHIGHHNGDFNEVFNGVGGNYVDYNISLAKSGFTFMITDTNLDNPTGQDPLDNDELKFVVSYVMEFEL
jgi:uncharacterized protein (TIGR02001 family)